jgi:hypothetical protein
MKGTGRKRVTWSVAGRDEKARKHMEQRYSKLSVAFSNKTLWGMAFINEYLIGTALLYGILRGSNNRRTGLRIYNKRSRQS